MTWPRSFLNSQHIRPILRGCLSSLKDAYGVNIRSCSGSNATVATYLYFATKFVD